MVALAGLEPARPLRAQDFLTTIIFITVYNMAYTFVVWTMPLPFSIFILNVGYEPSSLYTFLKDFMKHTYSINELKFAIQTSTSYRQVLQKLNIVPAGGNYSTLKKRIQDNQIDVSHFTGQLWSKGKEIGPQRPIQDYLSNKFSIQSHKLRKRLIREGIMKHECNSCGLSKWLDKPIPLELEHKDGNHSNNLLENLELLCPNCHAQTPTYRRRKPIKLGSALPR
jgi:hypothetical protein